MKKNGLRLLCCTILLILALLLSSCNLIPSMGGDTESESEIPVETVPVPTGKNTVFVLYEREGEFARVSVKLAGEVRLAGMEGALTLPVGAGVTDWKSEGGVTAAVEENRIRWILLSQTGENIEEETLLFTFVTEWTELSPEVTVSDAFDREMQPVEFCVEFYAFGK